MAAQSQHLLRIFTVPPEATVKHNGRLLGMTSPSGLMALWSHGDSITIEKAGLEPVKLRFTSSQPKKSIRVTLKPITAPALQVQPPRVPQELEGQVARPPLQSGETLEFIVQDYAENTYAPGTLEHDVMLFPNGWKAPTDFLKSMSLHLGMQDTGRVKLREPQFTTKHPLKGWILSKHSGKEILDWKTASRRNREMSVFKQRPARCIDFFGERPPVPDEIRKVIRIADDTHNHDLA